MMLCCIGINAQRIAVLEFNAGVGVSQADVDGISAIFNTYFSPKGYTLVERIRIDRAIDEQNFQRSCITEDQMVRLGEILNVSYIVAGTVNIIYGEYNVDAVVMNVQSGITYAKDGATWTSGTTYREMMKGLATRLSNKIAINPVAPSAPGGGGNSSSTSRKRTSVETIYGYLKVFPEELGSFESVPNTVITQLNSQAIYGYNTWRIPTNEELSLMKANGYLSGGTYMTKENTRGIVLLVTDKADAATLKAEAEQEAERKRQEYARTYGSSNGHDWVDLGLSVKWATCNVGATSPEEYGDCFAWGETSPKTEYTEENSLTYGKQMSDIAGNAQYDAARANWGGNWRMPTKAEMQELEDKCTWTWTTQNGVNGYKVTGPNGNSIFLPAAGYRNGSSFRGAGSVGNYWSSTPYGSYSGNAYYLYFNSGNHYMDSSRRYYGQSVRPVLE